MTPPNLSAAINEFHRARWKATIEEMLARFTGKTTALLAYEDVRRKLRANNQIARGLQDIRLDDIVGSVGRYNDFTRTFLPKNETDEQRWANLKVANSRDVGLPPIELYKIGEAYFVLDGNHRVSIARQNGASTIQAYVTEVLTKVNITPTTSPDDLIIKEQTLEFLESTKLDELRPEADFTVTAPGKYPLLLEHIGVHKYFMGLDFGREVSWEEAVTHWYDYVYLPVLKLIRHSGIMDEFPERTETDFYIWLADHRAELEQVLGWRLQPEEAVVALAEHKGISKTNLQSRTLLEEFFPEATAADGLIGSWRRQKEALEANKLFKNIVVSVGEDDLSWAALDQAIIVAQREGGQIRGLHVVSEATKQAELQWIFHERLAQGGVKGELAFESGEFYKTVTDRSRWGDVVVLSLTNPPGEQLFERWNSGWRNVILQSPRPILAVPAVTNMQKALLAYDGSPKANEALYVAAHVAKEWHVPLVVLATAKSEQGGTVKQAQAYLTAQGVEAEFLTQKGEAALSILLTAAQKSCDFILMGGYGSSGMVELFVGSTVDQVLRNAICPVWICR